jgi:hypothetical protein
MFVTDISSDQELVLSDFRNFLFLVWKHLRLPDPTPMQYEIAEYLQHGPKRQIIEAFRGVGKSWITSAYVLWRLLRDPNEKFLIVSASKQRSDDFSIFTQRLITEIPILQHLEPTDDQRSSKIAFDVAPTRAAHAPSVKSVGVFGQMTGSRATHIIADDVEVVNNSDTEDKRDKLLSTVMEFEAIIVPEVGRITYLGTPQTEASVYNKLRERGYACCIWTSRYPAQAELSKYEGCLAPTIYSMVEQDGSLVGKPTDPLRFTEVDLLEREAAYGKTGFALQFMLDTSLSDMLRFPLRTSDLIVLECAGKKGPISLGWASGLSQQIKELANVGFTGDRMYRPMFVDEKWAEYEGAVMTIDPSGRGRDETGYAVVKQLMGTLYVTDVGGLQGGYEPEVLTKLANIAKLHEVKYIIIEANFGDGMFTTIFQPVLARIYPCTTEEIKHNIQKEKRIIDTLEPVVNQHRLVLDLTALKHDLEYSDVRYSLLYQLTHITRDRGSLKHDDRLDALSMAVAYWVESMARDEKHAVEDHKARLLDDALKNFMDGVLGSTPSGNSWVKLR